MMRTVEVVGRSLEGLVDDGGSSVAEKLSRLSATSQASLPTSHELHRLAGHFSTPTAQEISRATRKS